MIKTVFLLLLIGHILGDFYLPFKTNQNFMAVVKHSLMYLTTLLLVIIPIFNASLVKAILTILVIHFLIKLVQNKIAHNGHLEIISYLIDQSLHILAFLITSIVVAEYVTPIEPIKHIYYQLPFSITTFLSWILALLIIAKPACTTIRKILYNYKPIMDESESGHPNAGALIGILERTIILLLLYNYQYSAIGFVLTAKSIARYNKIVEDAKFSEYYLLGTLLSVLLVLLTHLIIF
ncbi:MAG: DUF3307 domain-containing protein [Firmicutes bacterium]|nr:DUF3307 domain-containing protein [Bacillota bacterium]